MTSGFGVIVSKPGYDATTAADKDLVFSANFNQLKVKTSATAYITGDSSAAHNLSYTPVFLSLWSTDNQNFELGYGGVDSTAIHLEDYSSGTYFRYYIFFHQAI